MKKYFIGIDVSKEKLDICLNANNQFVSEIVVNNNTKAIKEVLKSLLEENLMEVPSILVCAEYTGQYTYPLSCICEELSIDLWLENPAQLKYRSGIQRGKNDKMDARKIAVYAKRYLDDMRLFSLPEKQISTLKQLISERDLYVVDKAKYQSQLTDQKLFMSKEDYKRKSKRLIGLIAELKDAINQIEQEIQTIIDNDDTLSNQHKLLCSVDGIGERTSIKMKNKTILITCRKIFKIPRKAKMQKTVL